jgi:MFS family permease
VKAEGVAALRHRGVKLLIAGQTVSDFGNAMFPIALVGLVGPQRPALLGLLLGVRGVATAVFGLPVRALVNRFRTSHVLVVCEAADMLVVLGYALGPRSPGVLVALSALGGGFAAAAGPAAGALLPQIAPAADLRQANAIKGVASRTAGIAGPAAAGALLVATGSRTVLLIDAATFLVSITAFLMMRAPRVPSSTGDGGDGERRTPWLSEIRAGFAEVRGRPWVMAVIAVATVQAPLTIAPGFTLLPIIAAHSYGTVAYGLALSAMACGEVIGGVIAARWTPRRPGLVSLAGVMPYPLVLLALAATLPQWTILAGYVLVGVGFMMFGVYWYTALQTHIPADRLAVVFSVDQVGSFGLQPLGYAAAGIAATWFGAPAVLVFAGGFGLVTTLIPLAVPGVPALADPPLAQPAMEMA